MSASFSKSEACERALIGPCLENSWVFPLLTNSEGLFQLLTALNSDYNPGVLVFEKPSIIRDSREVGNSASSNLPEDGTDDHLLSRYSVSSQN